MKESLKTDIHTPLLSILYKFRDAAKSEREKGTYFEELVLLYFRNEPYYKDYYSDVWMYSDWAKLEGKDARDVGIDLVAKTRTTNEIHAIQCKFYDADYKIQKADIDSFFTASGQKPFVKRIIVSTTNLWSEHADGALHNQTPPVTKIDLSDLENSVIDWNKFKSKEVVPLREQKKLRDHQKEALLGVTRGFQTADRGKLIMACGTGKTFTSLKIAEEMAGKGKRVLFLVPSLSLLSQSLTEWTQESAIELHSYAVCSDSEVGKKRDKNEDVVETIETDLKYPATTDAKRLAEEVGKRHDQSHMTVVFSTYHSIQVISDAQKKHKMEDFDLVICDEAHRTTGATFESEDESHFVKVHDNSFLKATKRLYMTATPRIYGDTAKVSAEKDNVTLCSMDDEKLFGKELYVINFSTAVSRGLLVDYKVIVLAVDENHVNARLQKLLADENNQIKVDDAAKIIGCWKALSKQGSRETIPGFESPMKRAVAFCQVIEYQKGAKTHKVSSKLIADMFANVIAAYQEKEEDPHPLLCEAEHVDGGMNAGEKEAKLQWLKEPTPDNVCRILSNVRCLSEGVDVPALDAVLFLTPRNSQVDVVQSVGRVMRNAPGKDKGYVILPVVIPAGVEPHEALNDNKTYKVVWQVLQALRSHDDRFDAMVNKLELAGPDVAKMEVIAVSDSFGKKKEKKDEGKNLGRGSDHLGSAPQPKHPHSKEKDQFEMQFDIGTIEMAIYAKVVQKCGNRLHWEEWAGDIAKIANTHISRIQAILNDPKNKKEIGAFHEFAEELRDDLNDSITDGEVVEMLAQHLITKPVFDALFQNEDFTKQNAVSRAMDNILGILQEHHLEKETDTLQRFYESVKMRASGITNSEGRQKIILELYDKFFSNAFPKLSERLGIVYTPVEAVDFILHSVADVLNSEFGLKYGDDAVQVLDPFTGTGTFLTRLLQSGLMTKEEIIRKYKSGLHANEIVLLAYYIASINIESTYHSVTGEPYTPFTGMLLTDTFQLFEKDDMISNFLPENSERRMKQKSQNVQVIVCNPPYSAGQTNENDNNQNVKYPGLDSRIEATYVKYSTATLRKNLYDSYIRAIRWASDRIGESGVMGFVTNASFIEGNSMDGLRKCLQEEFSSLYIFHLRGNQRTSGELSRKEGGKLFGSGSRAPIAITIFVKNPKVKETGKIYFHDIGDYLTREQKLERIRKFRSIQGITEESGWSEIISDKHFDWISQRDDSFNEFISLGDKKDKTKFVVFENFSQGLLTARDYWVYNFSAKELNLQVNRLINNFNFERNRINNSSALLSKRELAIQEKLNTDKYSISWSANLKRELERNREITYNAKCISQSIYRPFTRQWVYFDRTLNERVYQIPAIFHSKECDNLIICVTGVGEKKDFSVIISNSIVEYKTVYNGQCFPLYLYDTGDSNFGSDETNEDDLFAKGNKNSIVKTNPGEPKRRDAITDAGLQHFQEAYPKEKITKEDIFYYVYGLLHSPTYRERYADNLTKELPRIPRLKDPKDFWAFSKAGRALADLHIGYEKVKPYPVKLVTTKTLSKPEHYYVTQMKYAKNGKEKDQTIVIYNEFITITDIPLEAYEYVVNGKPALDWIIERYCVKTDKDSGIVNDANLWGIETENNPKYPLELFQKVITVSLETMKIVKGLPELEV